MVTTLVGDKLDSLNPCFCRPGITVEPRSPEVRRSNEKNPGCLWCIGDEKLPSYIGITINHEIRIAIN